MEQFEKHLNNSCGFIIPNPMEFYGIPWNYYFFRKKFHEIPSNFMELDKFDI